jgi:hypothetical protein
VSRRTGIDRKRSPSPVIFAAGDNEENDGIVISSINHPNFAKLLTGLTSYKPLYHYSAKPGGL